MRDVELYQHLLGVTAPWTVDRVELFVAEQRVDVWVEHPAGTRWSCPECSTELAAYDHAEERSWRHLDSCQFMTFLHARPPRVRCPSHGVLQVALPWAEPRSRFTALFERLAIDVLKACDVTGATRILRISWDEAFGIMERAVARGKAAKGPGVPARIGVDEKAAAKGHTYLTLVTDLDAGTVEYIADERTTASLDGYFEPLSVEQRASISAVAMVMWQPYVNSVLAHLPGASDKIVFDRFHIMGYLGKAVDTVRKGEHKALREVPVGMGGELPRLRSALQAVAETVEQVGDRPVARRVPRLGEGVGQLTGALGRPAQRRLRISPGGRLHHRFERRHQPPVLEGQPLAPPTGAPGPGHRHGRLPQLPDALGHGRSGDARRPGHRRDPAPAERLGPGSEDEPALPLVQVGPQEGEIPLQDRLVDHGASTAACPSRSMLFPPKYLGFNRPRKRGNSSSAGW